MSSVTDRFKDMFKSDSIESVEKKPVDPVEARKNYVAEANASFLKQAQDGEPLYGYYVPYKSNEPDFYSRTTIKSMHDLKSHPNLLITGKITKDDQYVQNDAAFSEKGGWKAEDVSAWKNDDLDHGRSHAALFSKIREAYPEFKAEDYEQHDRMCVTIPGYFLTDDTSAFGDPSYTEDAGSDPRWEDRDYKMLRLPDPQHNNEPYVQYGVLIDSRDLHKVPGEDKYLMVKAPFEEYPGVAFDEDGNVLGSVEDYPISHGVAVKDIANDVRSGDSKMRRIAELENREKEHQLNSEPEKGDIVLVDAQLFDAGDNRYDRPVAFVVDNPARGGTRDSMMVRPVNDPDHEPMQMNHVEKYIVDSEFRDWDHGVVYGSVVGGPSGYISRNDGGYHDLQHKLPEEYAKADKMCREYASVHKDELLKSVETYEKGVEEPVKSAYEHIKVPAGLVKGPFEGKNNQQFDVVSVPFGESKWGTMSVAEKQLDRGKTESSPVVMSLPADRERNVKVKGEDGKTSVQKLSPSDLHQMFDKNWQHLAERNKSAEYVSEDVKTAEASADKQAGE